MTDSLEERILADWDSMESRRRMVNETLIELAVKLERMGNSFLIPTSNPIEAARFDAARHAWLGAAKILREHTFDKAAQGSATLDGEVVRKEIAGG